jgi:hypothetical protein
MARPLLRSACGGGLTLFLLYHLKNRALPIGLMLVHGVGALAGLTLLFLALHRMPVKELYKAPEPTPGKAPAATQPAPAPPLCPPSG